MAGTLGFSGLNPCPHLNCPSRRTACGAVAMAEVSTAVRRPKSLYEVLRVKKTASAEEIKAAYRSMAKRVHPDVAPAAGGLDFLEIHRAYETLSDPTARARYDLSIGLFGFAAAAPLRSRRWETDQCW
ncbi:chaperone protein dnaJ 11, chloroplastic-like [Phoenix dactylifera]|uniref:Chaperone protein dnaJ 11, chloroplastic-like n=2 Tax=Phoenix dactylifera TaxID=42345 RepID=A0A8B9A580_PHODC|nr:chaperone protein dnaJ 11, chloroplastic-like [Phoenix dactylifera]